MYSRGSKRGKAWCFCSQSLQSIGFGRQGRHTRKKSIKPKRECASSWLERVVVSPGEIQKRARPLQCGQMEENFRIRRERKWPLANAAVGVESGSGHGNGWNVPV